MWPPSAESFCPILLCHHQSQFGIHPSPAKRNELVDINKFELTKCWPVLQFCLCHIAFLQWSQHPSQFSQFCRPVLFHSQTWWHFLNHSSSKTLKDNFKWLNTTLLLDLVAMTYSTKQNPQGVLVNLSNPMMILLTSPHFPNNSWI